MQALEQGDPRSVGRFRILARVGSGGMATVYLGRSAGGRAAAVKMMHAEFVDDEEHHARFRREVAATRAVGGLYSPGLLDADPDARRPWMATEFLPAVSLREAVRQYGPLPTGTVWSLAAGLAEALTLIHRAGYVHLDLKPANVLLTADGPRLIDFGIVGEVRAEGPVSDGPAGSLGFMSPEQEAGTLTGPPSDVFSLGSTLAFACTGSPPAYGSPPPIADDELQTMIAECLRHDPAARPSLPGLGGHLTSLVTRGAGPGWPPPIAAAIQRQVAEAGNPPVALSRPPQVRKPGARRLSVLSSVSALIVGLGVGALALSGNDSGPSLNTANAEPDGVPSATRTASWSAAHASPSPSAQSRVLEFYVTGDVTLTSLTYTVNGKSTTLKNVRLPWRTAIDIPEFPESGKWRLRYRHEPGNVSYRVVVDRIMHGYGGGGTLTGNEAKGTA